MPLLVVMVVVSLFVVAFAMQNAQTVTLNFMFFEMEGSLAFVAIVTFCCGLLVAGSYALLQKARAYLKMKKLQEQIDKLTQEKNKLEELITYLRAHAGAMPPEPAKGQEVKNPFIRQWK